MLLCLPVAAAAQVDRSTLSGVVRDSSGAIVPKATISTLAGDPRIMQFSVRLEF